MNQASLAAASRLKPALPIHRPEKQQKLIPTPKTASVLKLVSPSEAGEDEDDYTLFVKSLGLDDSFFTPLEDDEDFQLDGDSEDDEEDEDDGEYSNSNSCALESTPTLASPLTASPMTLPEWEPDFYHDLEEELGSLLEEDLEAAVTTLLTSKKPVSTPVASTSVPSPNASASKAKKSGNANKGGKSTPAPQESPSTPLRDAARHSARTHVTYQQSQQLRRLMTKHYQLLIQQAVLAVRAAHVQKLQKDKSDFLSGETADDLAEIIDGAVGMLQDLDQVSII